MKDRKVESHHQDRLKALSALIKIGTAIGFMPMELKTSLKFLAVETKKIFNAYGCAIFSLAGDACFDIIFSGPSEMGNGLLKNFKNTQQCLVVRDGLPFIVHDKNKRDKRCRGFEFDSRVESYVCLPISTGDKLVGVLTVSSLKKRAFAQHHLEMMLSVAAIAASVIQWQPGLPMKSIIPSELSSTGSNVSGRSRKRSRFPMI